MRSTSLDAVHAVGHFKRLFTLYDNEEPDLVVIRGAIALFSSTKEVRSRWGAAQILNVEKYLDSAWAMTPMSSDQTTDLLSGELLERQLEDAARDVALEAVYQQDKVREWLRGIGKASGCPP